MLKNNIRKKHLSSLYQPAESKSLDYRRNFKINILIWYYFQSICFNSRTKNSEELGFLNKIGNLIINEIINEIINKN